MAWEEWNETRTSRSRREGSGREQAPDGPRDASFHVVGAPPPSGSAGGQDDTLLPYLGPHEVEEGGANALGDGVLEGALVEREDIAGVDTGEAQAESAGFIGAGMILDAVAVVPGIVHAPGVGDLGGGEAGDARDGVADDLGLVAELRGIGDVLDLTSAAATEMGAGRDHAVGRGSDDPVDERRGRSDRRLQ